MWKATIDLKDVWSKIDTLSTKEVARAIVGQINKLPASVVDKELVEIKRRFERLPEKATYDDFNLVIEALYNWADAHSVWVATII